MPGGRTSMEKLPWSVMRKLTQYLDRQFPEHHNWMAFLEHAEAIGVHYSPGEVANFQSIAHRATGSPSEAIIQDFITRSLSTDQVYIVLREMGHVAGMELLKNHVSPHLLQEHNPLQNGSHDDGGSGSRGHHPTVINGNGDFGHLPVNSHYVYHPDHGPLPNNIPPIAMRTTVVRVQNGCGPMGHTPHGISDPYHPMYNSHSPYGNGFHNHTHQGRTSSLSTSSLSSGYLGPTSSYPHGHTSSHSEYFYGNQVNLPPQFNSPPPPPYSPQGPPVQIPPSFQNHSPTPQEPHISSTSPVGQRPIPFDQNNRVLMGENGCGPLPTLPNSPDEVASLSNDSYTDHRPACCSSSGTSSNNSSQLTSNQTGSTSSTSSTGSSGSSSSTRASSSPSSQFSSSYVSSTGSQLSPQYAPGHPANVGSGTFTSGHSSSSTITPPPSHGHVDDTRSPPLSQFIPNHSGGSCGGPQIFQFTEGGSNPPQFGYPNGGTTSNPLPFSDAPAVTGPTGAKSSAPSPDIMLSILNFKYSELCDATRYFTQGLIGHGAFGSVFKANVRGCGPYAIKKLHNKSEMESEMEGTLFYEPLHQESFMLELQSLVKYKNRNVLSLVAISNDGPRPCLIYEYMENGSLADCLQGKRNVNLSWSLRLDIAGQIAGALNFLHTANHPHCLVHGDVKSSNILLDRHFTPKLSDFGLAKECHNRPTNLTTVSRTNRVAMGTVAYMAPELLRNAKPSSKTDVYAFGVVMLELYTGKPADDPSRQTRALVYHLQPLFTDPDKNRELIYHEADDRASWSPETGLGFFDIATFCLVDRPKDRSPMNQVRDQIVILLEEAEAIIQQRLGGMTLSQQPVPQCTRWN